MGKDNMAHITFNKDELKMLYEMVEMILQLHYDDFLKGAPPIAHRTFGSVYEKCEKHLKKLYNLVD